ncbi:ATP-grasp domain-containing protein [Streptomyces lavendulocolor]|uniref:ATP-grasp domain-containing protein n=1 Tax=Streptomyces lavendulocolor TaxID=67316 RepID=UPI003C2C8BC3
MGATFIFCADPLRPRSTDRHFADEAHAVRALGHPVALVDHDALTAGDPAAAVARVPKGAGPAWYRGWMLTAAQYGALDAALAARGVTLVTTPGDYRRAHELPGWYDVFAPRTPRSVWLPCTPGTPPDQRSLATAATALGGGPGIVKDYVKSQKHEWDEACYVPDLTDTHRLASVVGRFLELRADALVGGVVIRAFENFRTARGEVRVWWVDGEPVLLTAHPDTPGLRPEPEPDTAFVRPLVTALGCRFVTTDLALREDGAWRVVEVGDGQVSDLPRGATAQPLLQRLATAGDAGGTGAAPGA